jgi:hypothetical protein
MRFILQAVTAALLVLTGVVAEPFDLTAQAAPPDPCRLLTKAELQTLTGHADAMAFPNQSEMMGAGVSCTVDGGGKNDLAFEFILHKRTTRVALTAAPNQEQLMGIGEGAVLRTTPGNAAVTAIKGAYSLRVGAQSTDTPAALKAVTIAVARAAVAKLP